MSNEKRKRKKNMIFISWSGESSKKIAVELKNTLENIIFKDKGLTCFVSELDIASGADWWYKIKKELKLCKQGILCITKENRRAPWIYFEAGAMIAGEIPTIPLLINCDVNSLSDSPIKGSQCVDFYKIKMFKKMIYDINNRMSLLEISREQLDLIAEEGYKLLTKNVSAVLKDLKNMRTFSEKWIYPKNITMVNLNTLYISAPMASIDNEDAYKDLRENILSLKDSLIDIGFSEINCPLFENETMQQFDGKTKAIKSNFSKLKEVESLLVIYPQKLPSSLLVETGYGLALCKRMVIFYRDGLPYILEEAGGAIEHVKTYKFEKFTEIINTIRANGMDIFQGEGDE